MSFPEIMRQALLILIVSSMCFVLLDRKYSLKKTLVIYGSTTALVIVLNVLITTFWGWRIFLALYPFVTNGILTITLFFLSKRKGFPVVFNMLTAIVFTNSTFLVSRYLTLENGVSIWIDIAIRLIMGVLLILFLYRYLRPAYIQMLSIMKRGWGYLCLIPGLYYLIIYINAVNTDLSYLVTEYRTVYYNFFLSLAITIAAYCIIFTLFVRIIRDAQMHDEQQFLKLQMKTMERHFEILKENEAKIQTDRTNSIHYIEDVKKHLESGNTKEALRLLGSIDKQDTDMSVPHYCMNPTVNAILVYYIRKAEHDKIMVEADCRLSENPSVEPSELAMVLANAIENAIHANNKLPANRERLIKIKLVSSPQLAVEVSNYYNGEVLFDENGLPVSKEIGHGLGTKSIAAFVEKHGGIIEYSADDTMFRMRLLINT